MMKRAREKAAAAAAAAQAAALEAREAAAQAAARTSSGGGSPFDVTHHEAGGDDIRGQLIALTPDDDQRPDQARMQQLCQAVEGGAAPHELAELAQAVAERLEEPSATVRTKVLRITALLIQRGNAEFNERLVHEAVEQLRASARFEAPPHPQYGSKPQQAGRTRAELS